MRRPSDSKEKHDYIHNNQVFIPYTQNLMDIHSNIYAVMKSLHQKMPIRLVTSAYNKFFIRNGPLVLDYNHEGNFVL